MVDHIRDREPAVEPTEILVGGQSYAIEAIVTGERPEIRAALVATSSEQQRRSEHLKAQLEAIRSRRRK